ncbi:MAG: hypothetical protein HQL50_03465 [Magnetococcales bacterium]|nr:hypothetical protein [Magnetococcales bacterium]
MCHVTPEKRLTEGSGRPRSLLGTAAFLMTATLLFVSPVQAAEEASAPTNRRYIFNDPKDPKGTKTDDFIYHKGKMHPVNYWWDHTPSQAGTWDYVSPIDHPWEPIPVVFKQPVAKLTPKRHPAEVAKKKRLEEQQRKIAAQLKAMNEPRQPSSVEKTRRGYAVREYRMVRHQVSPTIGAPMARQQMPVMHQAPMMAPHTGYRVPQQRMMPQAMLQQQPQMVPQQQMMPQAMLQQQMMPQQAVPQMGMVPQTGAVPQNGVLPQAGLTPQGGAPVVVQQPQGGQRVTTEQQLPVVPALPAAPGDISSLTLPGQMGSGVVRMAGSTVPGTQGASYMATPGQIIQGQRVHPSIMTATPGPTAQAQPNRFTVVPHPSQSPEMATTGRKSHVITAQTVANNQNPIVLRQTNGGTVAIDPSSLAAANSVSTNYMATQPYSTTHGSPYVVGRFVR